MLEDDLTNENLPEIPSPSENLTKNESDPAENPGGNADSKNSLAQKIIRSAGGVFERHGIKFRPGRGRPKKDGSPKISDVSLGGGDSSPAPADVPPVVPLAAPAPAPVRDTSFIKKIVRATVKGIFGTLDRLLKNKAANAGWEKADAEKLVASLEITDQEQDAFAELGVVVAEYFKVKDEHFALGGAVVLVGGIASRYALAFQEIGQAKPAQKKAGEK